jgi:hypothetical protein
LNVKNRADSGTVGLAVGSTLGVGAADGIALGSAVAVAVAIVDAGVRASVGDATAMGDPEAAGGTPAPHPARRTATSTQATLRSIRPLQKTGFSTGGTIAGWRQISIMTFGLMLFARFGLSGVLEA